MQLKEWEKVVSLEGFTIHIGEMFIKGKTFRVCKYFYLSSMCFLCEHLFYSAQARKHEDEIKGINIYMNIFGCNT